ncbi:MAG: hypothetical protein A2X23_12645 [Chloroflexi bacterium GWC2_73_18]|nr:MAG: hypothetical protein A2X23_12645 [Chloroflexi bacterium GWC2_73_18]
MRGGRRDRAARSGRCVRSLRVLFAPDSFKGSLDSVEVAAALADGWRRARPDDELLFAPLADGGEGMLRAIAAAEPPGLAWRRARTTDPIGRPIEAAYLALHEGDRSVAIVELAAASGLSRLAPDERDALHAGTEGTGDLLLAALAAGYREVILGIGGSATTDGGSGILRRLGARFLDSAGDELPPGGGALARLSRLDLDGLDRRLGELRLTIASDVQNPLLGPTGAAAIYGPQKGAAAGDVARLDAALARLADLLEAAVGHPIRGVAGSGAAGGTAAGLLAIADRLASLTIRPGVELVMELAHFDDRLRDSSLVVTGEGRIDAQTAFGKTVLGAARRAREAGIPCLVVAGSIGPGATEAFGDLVVAIVPTVAAAITVAEAMAAGAGPIADAGERVARLVSLGGRLGA